jgi:hypothetical protein
MPIAKSVEDTVLGEALAGNYEDILGVVSVIDNRARQTKTTYDDVVSAKGQFNAFGKALPPGVGKYRGLVQKAIAEVQTKGPVHQATFYATPAAAKGLPKGLAFEAKTAGHQYYSDPKGRSIATAQGYKTPDKTAMAPAQDTAPTQFAALPDVGPMPTSSTSGLLSSVAYSPEAASPATATAQDAFSAVMGGRISPPTPSYSEAVAAQQAATSPFDSVLGKTEGDLSPLGQGLLSGYANMTDPVAYGRTATATAQPFQGAVMHHAEPTTLSALRSVTNSPRSDGSYLGYTFGVDPEGNVAQLAPLSARTNHIGRVASNIEGLTNANSLGLAFTDAYGPITQKSIEAAAETIAAVNRAGQYGFIDPDSIGYHGKGATDTRSVEGQAEAEGVKSYLGGLPFGPNNTPVPGMTRAEALGSVAPTASQPSSPIDAPSLLGYVAMPDDGPNFGGVGAESITNTGFAAPIGAVERGTLGPVGNPGAFGFPSSLQAPNFSSSRLSQQTNIGPAATSFFDAVRGGYQTPTIDRSTPAGAYTPSGFANLGAIGKTGRLGVDPSIAQAPPSFGFEQRGLTAPNFAGPIGQAYNIDQAGLTAPGFTGPAARSVSAQSFGRAGATPAGFAELGAIGKTGRAGIAAPSYAPAVSILGGISMPSVGPNFGPAKSVAPSFTSHPSQDAQAKLDRAMDAMMDTPFITPPTAITPAAVVAPPAARSMTGQVSAPAMPMATAADVWGGKANVGRATNGNVVSRNPDGSVSMTSSKYGYTEVDGQYRGKVDPGAVGRVGQVGIPGPLGNVFGRAPAQQQTQPSIGPSMRGIGPAARGMAGSMAGGMVGSALGPLGGIIGAMIGRNLATGKSVTGKSVDSFGWGMPTATQARSAFAQGFNPGLGFPVAPGGNASQGGLTDFGMEAARGDHGGQAQSAANSPGRGLY